MTIIRGATACVSLLMLAGCVAVPAYAPPPPRRYEPPPPRSYQGRPPQNTHQQNAHQDRQWQDNQQPSNYSRSLGGSQTNPNVGQP